MFDYLKVYFIACLVTTLATPLAIKIAPHIGAMDVPRDGRRVHTKPTPRFGGIAIYLGFLVSALFLHPVNSQEMGIYIAATMILCLGIIDDIWGMKAKVKMVGQIICAVVLWMFSLQIRGMANIFGIGPEYIVFPSWLSLIITIIWILAIVNCINLIDGLDGLAAGIVFIACISIAYIARINDRPDTRIIILAVAGACQGFLFWNFNPAKIFMGDSGSMLLGLLLASVSMVGDTPTKSITLFSAILPMIILALPLFDVMFAIIRRTINHRPIMEADKGHLHHRIMAMGFGQRRTVLALYSISAILGVAGILWTNKMKLESIFLMAIAGMLIFIFLGIGIDHDDRIAKMEAIALRRASHNRMRDEVVAAFADGDETQVPKEKMTEYTSINSNEVNHD